MADLEDHKEKSLLDLPLGELMQLYKAHQLAKIEEEVKQLQESIERRKKEIEAIGGENSLVGIRKEEPVIPAKRKRTKKWAGPAFSFLHKNPNVKYRTSEIAENIIEGFSTMDDESQKSDRDAISYALSRLATKLKKIKSEEIVGEKGNFWYYEKQENE